MTVIMIETGKHREVSDVQLCSSREQVWAVAEGWIDALGIYDPDSSTGDLLTMSRFRQDMQDHLLSADDRLEYEHSGGGYVTIWLK